MTTQAISTITTIPAQAIDPGIMYLPQRKFGHVVCFLELEINRTREAEVVADILDGQHIDIVKVIAVDLANGTSWDATREIADEIFNHLIRTGSNVQPHLIDFLEANIAYSELAPYLRHLAA